MFRQETFPIPTALGGRAAKMFQILLRGWVIPTGCPSQPYPNNTLPQQVQLMPVGVKIAETRFVSDSLFPVWAEEFRLLLCHNAETIKISVFDK